MMMSNLPILTFLAMLAIGNHPSDGGPVNGAEFQPEFSGPLENLTVPVGRDATFTCTVSGLGGYRVGWVRADSKAIQAIHTHVITHNPRVFVSHSDHTMWHLTIKGVKEEDRGSYMCQINTDPMISQVAVLEVVIPPEFIPEETSGDIMAPEGSTVKLTCKARGHPTPSIKWRREDGQNITMKSQGTKTQVTVHEGEILKLQKISRADMGTYLCISSNSVPPSISKRITVSVHFHPVIHVPNQLVGAPVNTDVTLECNVEAYPRSIHFWVKDQEFKVDGETDRTGTPNIAFDEDDNEDELDSTSSYEMGERHPDRRNGNRHTYTNKNSVIVGAGGGKGNSDTENSGSSGGYGVIGGTGCYPGTGSGSHHNTNNHNRGKQSNYTPGGERERIQPNSSSGRGGKESRQRHTKKPSNSGKHLDTLGPGSSNVYQTHVVPDGNEESSTSSASTLYRYTSTNKHYHNEVIEEKEIAEGMLWRVRNKLAIYFHSFLKPILVSGWGFLLHFSISRRHSL